MDFAGQHARHADSAAFPGVGRRGGALARHRIGTGIILAMNDNEQNLAQRIKDLEGAARKVRLEAMQIAATLLTKENALLAGPRANHPDHKGDLATLRARYAGLVKTAEDTQAMIDKLQAEEHDTKYHR
jgi:hypothetical protein